MRFINLLDRGLALILILAAGAGCATAPRYRAHPELPQRAVQLRTVGIMPPSIAAYEERAWKGVNPVPNDDWSRQVERAVQTAFAEEMRAMKMPVVLLDGTDPDLEDMADLFSAVDFTFQRHGCLGITHEPPFWTEDFPAWNRSFNHSLGPAKEAMTRHGIDAVWFVRGYNLFPTAGAKTMDTIEVIISLIPSYSPGFLNPQVLMKCEVRAALVDRDGTILFYGKVDEATLSSPGATESNRKEELERRGVEAGDSGPRDARDLRDRETARRYVKTLLSKYRKAVAP